MQMFLRSRLERRVFLLCFRPLSWSHSESALEFFITPDSADTEVITEAVLKAGEAERGLDLEEAVELEVEPGGLGYGFCGGSP